MPEVRFPLCVLTPELGVHSETFIRWAVHDLYPAGTVAISDPPPAGETIRHTPAWRARVPTLRFEPLAGDPLPPPRRLAAAGRFLRAHGVRVVLVEYLDFATRWLGWLLEQGVGVWLRGHGVDLSARLREPGWRAAYQRCAAADGILVPSHAAGRRLVALGLPDGKVHVVPYGTRLGPRPRPCRDRRGAPRIRCIAVGRLVAKKAPLDLLEAFRQASIADPRLSLDLVGDGPLLPKARTFVTAHGLTGRVRLHGRLPHDAVLALLSTGDLFVHHAVTAPDDGDAEGLPVVILEAMAAGLPVVATAHEGIPEVVCDGVHGLLVPERDCAGMADRIRALAADASRRARMADAAWTAVRDHHTHAHYRTRVLTLLGLGTLATRAAHERPSG